MIVFLARRAYLNLRGFDFVPRDEMELSPIELLRIDTCISLSRILEFHARGLGTCTSATPTHGVSIASLAGSSSRSAERRS